MVTRAPVKTKTVVKCEELRAFKHRLPMSHISRTAFVTGHLSPLWWCRANMHPLAGERSDSVYTLQESASSLVLSLPTLLTQKIKPQAWASHGALNQVLVAWQNKVMVSASWSLLFNIYVHTHAHVCTYMLCTYIAWQNKWSLPHRTYCLTYMYTHTHTHTCMCMASLVVHIVVCLQCGRPRFNPWVGKIPWKRKW